MKWYSIAKKDIKLMLKDPSAIVVLLLLPIMFITIMSLALSSTYGSVDAPIEIVYLDQDQTKMSDKYINRLQKIDGIMLKKTVSEKEGKKQIDKGKYPMFLIVPKAFSEELSKNGSITLKIYSDSMQKSTVGIFEQTIRGISKQFELESQLELYGVSQEKIIGNYLNGKIKELENRFDTQSYLASNTDNLVDGGLSESIKSSMNSILKKNVIKQEARTNNSSIVEPDTFQQNVPGYTVMFAFFIIMWAGKSFLSEKNNGTWDRIMISNISTAEVYLGKYVPNFLIGLLQVTLLFSFGHFAFGMGLGSSPISVGILSVALIICSTSLGMLISSIAKTDSQVTGVSLFIVLTSAAIGGTMVPLTVMPDFMQKIAKFVPQSWALEGYQNLIVRNQGFQSILPNILVLLSFSLVFLVVAFVFIRRAIKK